MSWYNHLPKMCSILVYNGKGSKNESINLFFKALQDVIDISQHDVRFISADEVKEGSWRLSTKLFCMGGGYDLGYIESLGSIGVKHVKEYVSNGGSFLGICAGAYFATDFIEFDKNGPLEVVGERHLKFYDGKCIGPAFPGFDYSSRSGVVAAPIKYKDTELHAYFEGGGYFIPYSSSSNKASVLGQFESLKDKPAALVKCQCGLGSAILSAVHIEYSSSWLDQGDQYLSKELPNLSKSERIRQHVFTDILKQLGINCHKDQRESKI